MGLGPRHNEKTKSVETLSFDVTAEKVPKPERISTMRNARKQLIGAAMSLTLLLGTAGSLAANGPGGDHPANAPFGDCVRTMAQTHDHDGLGRHHRATHSEESLGSHLQKMREMMKEDGTCEMP